MTKRSLNPCDLLVRTQHRLAP